MTTSQNLQENSLVLSRSLQMPSRSFRQKAAPVQRSRIVQDGLNDQRAFALLQEAASLARDLLIKDLLVQPVVLIGHPGRHSRIHEGKVEFQSAFVAERVNMERQVITDLQFQLGSSQGMSTGQRRAASFGALAGLFAWKVAYHPNGSFHDRASSPHYKKLSLEKLIGKSYAELEKTINQFISDDIDLLTEIGYLWEEKFTVPLIENLYEICLSHALGNHPQSGIANELELRGIYHPFAQGIAKVWQKAWMSVATIAAPLLKIDSPLKSDGLESKDLADQVSTTGTVAPSPAIVKQTVDSFLDTSVSTTLLDAFKTALRQEFDSVAGPYLRTDAPGLSKVSKEVYADLMNRQLNMLAQFWRQ